jgi:hypothetical protein
MIVMARATIGATMKIMILELLSFAGFAEQVEFTRVKSLKHLRQVVVFVHFMQP